ncbi:MAG TPA: hypothetical protein VEZ20_10035 [Allosphingosinicella sp.]|jgi:hypothetical protein|nr:hypothetical protein [Allosphingosinicella sp.]
MRASRYSLGFLASVATRAAPVALLLCLTGATAQRSAFDPYEQGDMLSRRLMEGDVAALEQAMTPRFLAGIGGREGLARMIRELRSEAGRESNLLRQVAYSEAGHVSYYRVSRFERMPSVTTRWVFDADRKVAALSVRPSQAPAPTRRTRRRLHPRATMS